MNMRRLRPMRTYSNTPIMVVEDEAPVTPAQGRQASTEDDEITVENPSPEEPGTGIGSVSARQESVKHNLASRLYKAVETAYGSVYELTEVLNEIGRGYKAPALKGIGNASLNLQGEIEGMPGLLDGKHEKEDVIRFMGLMDEITND